MPLILRAGGRNEARTLDGRVCGADCGRLWRGRQRNKSAPLDLCAEGLRRIHVDSLRAGLAPLLLTISLRCPISFSLSWCAASDKLKLIGPGHGTHYH